MVTVYVLTIKISILDTLPNIYIVLWKFNGCLFVFS